MRQLLVYYDPLAAPVAIAQIQKIVVRNEEHAHMRAKRILHEGFTIETSGATWYIPPHRIQGIRISKEEMYEFIVDLADDVPQIVVVGGVSHFVTDRPSDEPWTSKEWLAFVDWSMQQVFG